MKLFIQFIHEIIYSIYSTIHSMCFTKSTIQEMNIDQDTSICTLSTNMATDHADPFMIMIPTDMIFSLSKNEDSPEKHIVPSTKSSSDFLNTFTHHDAYQTSSTSTNTMLTLHEDKNIIEGTSILFVMQRIVFARRPHKNFKHVLHSSLSEYKYIRLLDTSEFNIDLHEPGNSKIPFDFFLKFLKDRHLNTEHIQGNLHNIIESLQERKPTGTHIAICSLNSNYTHPSNKNLKKNPFVEHHCVIFRNGYILCDYLSHLKDAKLSIIKHLTITSGDMNVENTSPTSYISRIKAIYKVV